MPKAASRGDKGGKKEKDPNAPKRNLSAYFLFCAEERGKVKASDPGLSLGDTAKELGRRWAAVNPSTKAKFEQLAKKEKERYEKEMQAYKGGAGSSAKAAGGQAARGQKSPAKKATKAPVQEDSDQESEDEDDD